MLSLHDISTSLHVHWLGAAPAGVPTLLAGVDVSPVESTDWFEFWIDAADEAVHRDTGPAEQVLFLTVHCFSRQSRDTLRAQTLADAIVAALARRTLPIDAGGNPGETVGRVRILEPSVRQLTRLHVVENQQPLQHVVVTFTARATSLTAP
jgi:hypothetical protein